MDKQIIVLGANGRALASIEDIIATKQNKFLGWHCETGMQNLYIDFDGKVWVGNCASSRANQRVAFPGEGRRWGNLGRIGTEFKLPTIGVTCPFTDCGCGSDIVTTKYRTESSVDWFVKPSYHKPTIEFSQLTEPCALRTNYRLPKQVLWDIGRRCNYDCSYCWPSIHNTTDHHKPLAMFTHTADYLLDKWSNGEQIRWYFGGGEPTLNPDFEPFVDYLAEKGQWMMLVTNASQGPSYWSKNADNYNTLIFSAHFEFMKPELFVKNYSRVVEVISNSPTRLNRFIVKLMTKPAEIDNSIEFVNMLKTDSNYDQLPDSVKTLLGFDMVPLRDIVDGSKLHTDYTQGELDRIFAFNATHS